MKIADRLKFLREEKELNKRELSESLGIPYSTYNNWEIGAREPNSEHLMMFAKYYEVTIDFLLGYTDDKNNHIEFKSLAAHHEGDEWTPEELEDLAMFKELIMQKRLRKKGD